MRMRFTAEQDIPDRVAEEMLARQARGETVKLGYNVYGDDNWTYHVEALGQWEAVGPGHN